MALLRLHQLEHVFILMMHHIICDWASEGIIWRELSALYGSAISGETGRVTSIAGHARGLCHRGSSKGLQIRQASSTIWRSGRRPCAGAPALLELPADRAAVRRSCLTREAGSAGSSARVLTEALRTVSRQEKTSLFTIFAAALDMLLYRYTGSEDILLGIPLADRDQQELQSVIGFLLHTHVLRTRLSGEMTFRDLLRRVQKAVLDLYISSLRSRSIRSFGRLQPERNLSYTPLFQVMLNWRDRDQHVILHWDRGACHRFADGGGQHIQVRPASLRDRHAGTRSGWRWNTAQTCSMKIASPICLAIIRRCWK